MRSMRTQVRGLGGGTPVTGTPLLSGVAALLILLGVLCAGQGFQEAPPTWGLGWPTVYTLRTNELQVGFSSITDPNSLYVNLGVRSDLQVGFSPMLLLAQRIPNVGGKLRVSLTPELDFALPLHVYYWTNSGSYQLHIGGVLGVPLGRTVGLHAGVQVVTGRYCDWGCRPVLYSIPYGILDLGLSETARALVELEPTPFKLRVGVLARLFEFVDLRAAVSLIPHVAVWVGVEGRLVLARRAPGPQ